MTEPKLFKGVPNIDGEMPSKRPWNIIYYKVKIKVIFCQ